MQYVLGERDLILNFQVSSKKGGKQTRCSANCNYCKLKVKSYILDFRGLNNPLGNMTQEDLSGIFLPV